jgi:hypothetical protein
MSNSSILQFEPYVYPGLRKVISGGQDGVDIAGLAAAHNCGLNTGGHCPHFFKTHSGPNLELGGKYGLTETISTGYPTRTGLNVQNSDGTLIFGSKLNSPGITLTRRFCKDYHKKFWEVQLPFTKDECLETLHQNIKDWIIGNEMEVLNIAGNRDKNTRYGNHYHDVYFFLTHLFVELRKFKS